MSGVPGVPLDTNPKTKEPRCNYCGFKAPLGYVHDVCFDNLRNQYAMLLSSGHRYDGDPITCSDIDRIASFKDGQLDSLRDAFAQLVKGRP